MPSPFPGMDPYLEGDLWTAVHSQLAADIVRQLMPKVAPRYVALHNKRFVVETPGEIDVIEGSIYPDVGVVKGGPAPFPAVGGPVLTAPLQMETVLPEAVPHLWVEIRDTARRHLVTTIEFLSPTNKRGKGRAEYLEKRQRLLKKRTTRPSIPDRPPASNQTAPVRRQPPNAGRRGQTSPATPGRH